MACLFFLSILWGMENLVSIIMPNFNGEAYIAQSIQSVLDQGYKDWELLIVDDNSSDNSLEIIKSFADSRIKIFKNDAKGAASARNLAMREAKGKYIAFLDNDDLWRTDKLSKQIAYMKVKNLAFTYSYYQRFNDAGENLGLHKPAKEVVSYTDILKSNPIGCVTVVYDREKIGEIQIPHIKMRNDYAIWLKILKQGHKADLIKEVLADYRIRTNSLSSNKVKAAIYQFYFLWKIEKLGFMKALYYFCHYAFGNVFKRIGFIVKK